MPTKPGEKLRIAITGATGLVGQSLAKLAGGEGHTVLPVRRDGGEGRREGAQWDVNSGKITFPGPVDVLVHLAGRSVAARWSARVKMEIWDSRVPATEKLCAFLASMPASQRPKLLISASAIGTYGDRGDEVLTEDSPVATQGASFLGDVGLGWEAGTRLARDAGIGVVIVRIGIVLARKGGALAKLVTPTKLGLGGPVGPGTQFMPWISLTDLSRLLLHLAQVPSTVELPPIVNGVAPPPGSPVRQHEFMRTLGRVLHRPTIFPMPSFMVKLAFGQMGQEMLLGSLRVVPTKLPADFTFIHSTLEGAIRAELQPGA